VRAEQRKPATLFAPSRCPVDAVAPTSVSVESSSQSCSNDSVPLKFQAQHINKTPAAERDVDDLSPLPPSSSFSSSEEASSADDTSSSSSSSSGSSTLRGSVPMPHQEEFNIEQGNIYTLQDENADLRKAIQSLEIVLRDHGFTRDGKHIIPDGELLRVDGDNDEDGLQRSHMLMMSMTGMDPERPTVLCKYMEFKVAELENELEAVELEKDKMAALLRTMTEEVSVRESQRFDKLRASKTQKRKLEERLKNSISVSKTRETLLAQKLGGLESNLERSQKKEDLLRRRIQSLEKELEVGTKNSTKLVREELLGKKVEKLETKLESYSTKETQLREQITALETNLEWNLEESTKRENALRSQIVALETNLEWKIDDFTKREDEFLEKIQELEDSQQQGGPNDDDDDEEEEATSSHVAESLTLGETLADTNVVESLTLGDDSLTQEDLISAQSSSTALHAFQQSLSELSRAHNKQLEEWKRQESKEREDQLEAQINALETNLEWNLKESKKREDILREQVTALENNLEWNLEDFAKKEARLNERIAELAKPSSEMDPLGDNDSLTVDSLIPPDDALEQKQQLEKIKQQKHKLEEYLSMVVQESTKREKNLQQIIGRLESTTQASTDREKALQSKVSELETKLEEEKATDYERLDDLEKAWVVAMAKETEKQHDLAHQVSELEGTVETNKVVHYSKQGDLLARVDELEALLAASEQALAGERAQAEAARTESTTSEQDDPSGVAGNDDCPKEEDVVSARILELEDELEKSRQVVANTSVENREIAALVAVTEEALAEERSKQPAVSPPASERSDASGSIENDEAKVTGNIVFARILELEKELEKTRKAVKSTNAENEELSHLVSDLEQELEDTRDGISEERLEHKCMSGRMEALEQDLEAGRGVVASTRGQNKSMSRKIADLEIELEETCDNAANIRIENKDLVKRCVELKKELDEERRDKSYRNRILESSRDAASSARGVNNDLTTRIFELERELERTQIDAASAKGENQELAGRIAELEGDLKKEREDKAHRDGVIAGLRKDLAKANTTVADESVIAELRRDLETAVAANKSASGRIFDLENELESTRQEKFERNKRVTKLQNDIEDIARKNEDLNETVLELETELERERSDKFNRNKRIAELQANLDQAPKSHGPGLARNAGSDAGKLEREKLSKRVVELQTELETNAKFFQSMKAYNRTLEMDQEAAEREHERLRKRIEELTQNLEEEESNHGTVDEVTITATAEELESPNSKRIRFNKFVSDLSNLQEEKKEKMKEMPLIEVIPEIENEPEPERTEEPMRKRVKPKAAANVRWMVIAELEKELENRETRNELSELQSDYDETILNHEVKQEDLKNRIQELENELEVGQTENERLERVIFVIRNELDMAAEIQKPLAARNKELEQEVASRKAEAECVVKELVAVRDELEDSNKQFNNEIVELKMKLKAKQSEFEHLGEFKHELEAELEATTAKVQNIEKEFETAAQTMDSTYEELSVRNAQVEKELVSYKSENQYLNKFIGELQQDMEKKQLKKTADGMPELKKKDSLRLSDCDSHDELIESERVNHGEPADNFMGSEFLHKSDLLIDESSSDEESEDSRKTTDDDDDDDGSSSSSSKESESGERKRLSSEIEGIEKKLFDEKTKQTSLAKSIADLEEEKKKIQGKNSTIEGNSASDLIAQIRESEAELEALNAHIYELEADLEYLLDEMWDYEQSKKTKTVDQEHKQDLEDIAEGSDEDLQRSQSNREHLSTRILELEKEMEELEDELDETIEANKNQRQMFINKNNQLQGKLDATIEKAKKEHFNLAVRYNELENKLQATIERGRKEQKDLAIHYIEKERELKQTSAKARAEEKRLNAIIKKLEKEIKTNRSSGQSGQSVQNDDGFLLARLSILMEDVDSDQKRDSKEDAKQRGGASEKSQRQKEELLLSTVSKLKDEHNASLSKIKVLNNSIADIEGKLQSSQEIMYKAEKEVKDLNESYAELETKCKINDEDNETAIWEAEQKMRDLMDSASLERKEKNRFKLECSEHKREIESLREENQKLSSQNEIMDAAENSGRDALVRRVAELEEEVRSLSTDNVIELEIVMKRMKDLRDELEICKRQNRSFSSQIDCHEEERKKYAELPDRYVVLEKELQSSMEETKNEKRLHSELKERLIEVTMKNQADKANLDALLRKLQRGLESTTRELESTRETNRSLAYDLKFFESEKDRLNRSDVDYIEDDLRSTLEENDSIFQKIQSYERGGSSKSMLSQSTPLKEGRNLSPTTPHSKDRTVTENTYDDDEDTLPSDVESDTAKSGEDVDSDTARSGGDSSEASGRGVTTMGSDSNHNSIMTAKVGNGIANGEFRSPASLPFESIDTGGSAADASARSGRNGGAQAPPSEPEEDAVGTTKPRAAPTEEQKRKTLEYLTPLIDRADEILGQEVPLAVVQGVQDLLATRADEVDHDNLSWEDFEQLLEEVCQEFDEDTWFEIQEAFFVAWEEIEIEKMGGDLSEAHDDTITSNGNEELDDQ